MEIQVIYKDKALVKFKRDIFLSKFKEYFKKHNDIEKAFESIELDIKKELLKL